MNIAVLWQRGLVGDALASLLQHDLHFTVVAVTPSVRDCLTAMSKNPIGALVIQSELDLGSERELLEGARLVGGFRVVSIAETEGVAGDKSLSADRSILLSDGKSALSAALAGTERARAARLSTRSAHNDDASGLTRREAEVVRLLSQGCSNRRIAEVTGLQEQSVKNLVSSIMRRFGLDNRTQLALRFAMSSADIVNQP